MRSIYKLLSNVSAVSNIWDSCVSSVAASEGECISREGAERMQQYHVSPATTRTPTSASRFAYKSVLSTYQPPYIVSASVRPLVSTSAYVLFRSLFRNWSTVAPAEASTRTAAVDDTHRQAVGVDICERRESEWREMVLRETHTLQREREREKDKDKDKDKEKERERESWGNWLESKGLG